MKDKTTRRGFLGFLAGLFAAPAVAKAGLLEGPVEPALNPATPVRTTHTVGGLTWGEVTTTQVGAFATENIEPGDLVEVCGQANGELHVRKAKGFGHHILGVAEHGMKKGWSTWVTTQGYSTVKVTL